MRATNFRKSLLGSSAIAATAAVLMIQAAPALATCPGQDGTTCFGVTNGATGAPAPGANNGSGHDGGNGGTVDPITLGIDHVGLVSDSDGHSPIDLRSYGGVGAQGSDATAFLTNDRGGNGGIGGDGGEIDVTTGAYASGLSGSGLPGMALYTIGGAGGAGALANLLPSEDKNGVGGVGGRGGTITIDLDGDFPQNSDDSTRALTIVSAGGAGGNGRNSGAGLYGDGPDAGAGGDGGAISGTLRGNFIGGLGGVSIRSLGSGGGNGGNGGNIDGDTGGDAGAGGNGNTVGITVVATANLGTYALQDAGLLLQSAGGSGGVGGTGATGGNAGAGGNGGNVTAVLQGGQIVAYGETQSPGLLAQSLGGNGGDGGAAQRFVIGPNGGAGSVGGTAGTVNVQGGGLVTIITGKDIDLTDYPASFGYSPGILAQSIGGGGGGGGDAKGFFAVGGNGGNGVDGNMVSVDVQANITTWGTNSDGIAVQSIGGGGGKGADAQGSGVEVNMVIGGTAGGGGTGSTASAQLQKGSVINTAGSHSNGILIQSIGGGGGAGGAAYSKSTNLLYGASISLGGTGGAGGEGSTVGFVTGATTTNGGRILTSGTDSHGIVGQSIGGGGGIGGASTAISKTYSGDDYPGLSLALAMGGSGGQGGAGGDVTLDNSGLILTGGAGSIGVLGQSIGGGGGAGGDSSATSTATKGAVNISVAVALGGSAGSGNDGEIGTLSNGGFIITTGESADGMLVQSIGGGGGAGGGGDGKSTATKGTSIAGTLAMGSKGGGGGKGQSVFATNVGTIITLGDGAMGIGAQSIGGGGGRGGGAAGSASGDYSATVSLGSSGGNGGNSNGSDGSNAVSTATVTNKAGATIVTFGADATGILAQSIGGGGGAGGKSASNISTKKSTNDGGNGDAAGTASTATTVAASFDGSGLAGLSSYAGLNGAVAIVNSLLAIAPPTSQLGDAESDLDTTAQSKGETDDDNESTSIQLSVGVGGSGGNGGDGGRVLINNYGEVATLGHNADAIIGQSIGGGGGKGGASSTATSDDNKNANLAVGGSGGFGGTSTIVTITNTGAIYTKGAMAAGIVGQSISGGGGIGGVSASSVSASSKKSGNDDANDGAFQSLSISVGGSGGNDYSSGQVVITNSGAISTTAHDSIGIFAQSITGGGGIVKTLATDLEGAGGTASTKGTDHDIQFKFNGSTGSNLAGSGQVSVTTTKGGAITTKGDNSYGILAQSIAGGGGLVLGGNPTGNSAAGFFGAGATQGSVINDGGSNSGLFVNVGDNITTAGNGAIGVVAQSIGGGGGLAGNTGNTEQFFTMSGATNKHGNGGKIDVTLGAGATIQTTGNNAPAMFLQSIGGGGGRITNSSGAFIGTAGGSGTGGEIDVTINGSIAVTGLASIGVFAQSVGDSTSNSPITLTVGASGVINVVTTSEQFADGTSAGVYIDHGGMTAATPNVVTNNGTLFTYGPVRNSVAVWSTGGYTAVTNTGLMGGDILLLNNGGQGCFTNSGSFVSGDTVAVGACGVSNSGTMTIKGDETGTTTIIGNYRGSGKLLIDADFAAGTSDRLVVTGDARVGDTVTVNAKSISNRSLKLVSAGGTLALDPAISMADNSHLYDFKAAAAGKDLLVVPVANFTVKAAGLGANERSVAGNLQALFDGNAAADAAFNRLFGVVDDAGYAAGLKSLAGQGLGAFGAFRFNSSRTFAANLYGGCQDFHLKARKAGRCVWSRVLVNDTTQNAGSETLGYHADSFASQKGIQWPVGDNLAVIGSLAYENTKFNDSSRSARITGDSVLGGVGLLYTPARLELSAGIDAAYGWYKSRRSITLGLTEQADGRPEQSQIGGHVRGAINVLKSGKSFVRPFVEGHAIHVSNKAFTETGTSPFRLAVEGQSDTALIGVLGVEMGTRLPLSAGVTLRPFASAALEYGSPRSWTTTARFADQLQGASFDLKTAGPGTLGRFSIGADIIGAKNVAFSVQYAPELGKDFTSHSGTARLTIAF